MQQVRICHVYSDIKKKRETRLWQKKEIRNVTIGSHLCPPHSYSHCTSGYNSVTHPLA
jgi:hypothetical protein